MIRVVWAPKKPSRKPDCLTPASDVATEDDEEKRVFQHQVGQISFLCQSKSSPFMPARFASLCAPATSERFLSSLFPMGVCAVVFLSLSTTVFGLGRGCGRGGGGQMNCLAVYVTEVGGAVWGSGGDFLSPRYPALWAGSITRWSLGSTSLERMWVCSVVGRRVTGISGRKLSSGYCQ